MRNHRGIVGLGSGPQHEFPANGVAPGWRVWAASVRVSSRRRGGRHPLRQRAAAIQAASVVSATSWASVVSNQAAFNAEVAATLTGLGLWKGAA